MRKLLITTIAMMLGYIGCVQPTEEETCENELEIGRVLDVDGEHGKNIRLYGEAFNEYDEAIFETDEGDLHVATCSSEGVCYVDMQFRNPGIHRISFGLLQQCGNRTEMIREYSYASVCTDGLNGASDSLQEIMDEYGAEEIYMWEGNQWSDTLERLFNGRVIDRNYTEQLMDLNDRYTIFNVRYVIREGGNGMFIFEHNSVNLFQEPIEEDDFSTVNGNNIFEYSKIGASYTIVMNSFIENNLE